MNNIDTLINKYIVDHYPNISKRISYNIVFQRQFVASNFVKIEICLPEQTEQLYIKLLHNSNKAEFEKHKVLIIKEYYLLKKMNSILQKPISVIEPVACYPDYLALITREFQGVMLRPGIVNSIKKFNFKNNLITIEMYLKRCAKFLKIFQKATVKEINSEKFLGTLIKNTLMKMSKYEDDMFVKKYQGLRIKTKKYIEYSYAKIAKSKITISSYHGDFGPGNIMIKDGCIAVLDFSDSKCGSIYRDIASFYQSLDNYKYNYKYNKNSILKLQDSFLSFFEDINMDLFNFYRVSLLLSSVNERFRIYKNHSGLMNTFLNKKLLLYRLDELSKVVQTI